MIPAKEAAQGFDRDRMARAVAFYTAAGTALADELDKAMLAESEAGTPYDRVTDQAAEAIGQWQREIAGYVHSLGATHKQALAIVTAFDQAMRDQATDGRAFRTVQ